MKLKCMSKFKAWIYEVLEVAEEKKGWSYFFDLFIIILIALNAIAIVMESVDPVKQRVGVFFYYFEVVSVVIFTLEYVLRVWSVTEASKYKHPFWGRLRFVFTPLALIDFFAILPFYLVQLADLRFLRILRLFRLFRLFKLARYVKALQVMSEVIRKKREQLVVSTVFTLFLLLIVSSVMYYVEHPVQPEAFSSIPDTMWWGIATLTTVGYGDVYPITPLGKFLGGVIAILGIGIFALPAGILASGFSTAIEEHTDEE